MTPGAGWLSATSVGRLLHCPASASFAAAPKLVPTAAPRNAGTLAHLAMNSWVESGAWLEDEPGRALQAAWDSEAVRWKVDAKRFRDSVMTRARLRSRGAELAVLLRAVGKTARSEVFLRDEAEMLYGQLDVLAEDVEGGAVVDLKTGADGHSESVRTQLLVYAHLFRARNGRLPASVVAFSLMHGAVSIDVSESAIAEMLTQVTDARGHPSLALPDPGGCRYCRRRLACQPHWDAAAAWVDPDCIEGPISKVETAAGGLTAVRVSTAAGEQWVTGLAPPHPHGLTTGNHVRVTEVTGRRAGADGERRANRSTRASVLPNEGQLGPDAR